MRYARVGMFFAAVLATCGWLATMSSAQVGGGRGGGGVMRERVVSSPPTVAVCPSAAATKIQAALNQPVTFDFVETPLNDVLIYIKDNHDLQVFVDSTRLADAGIDTTTLPITSSLQGITLQSALSLILNSHGLTWYIGDEVLKITTKEAADERFETRLYDVSDLVGGVGDRSAACQQLRQAIVGTVKGNWQEGHGAATICAVDLPGVCALSVAQTYDGHQQVAQFLEKLRTLKTPAQQLEPLQPTLTPR